MAIIKIEKNVNEYNLFSGSTRQVLHYDTDTYKFTFKNSYPEKIVEWNVNLDFNMFKSYDPDFKTKEDIAKYLLSIGIDRISNLPTKLRKELNEKKTAEYFKEFVEKLKQLNDSDCIANKTDDRSLNIYDSKQELVSAVESLANVCLIADEGRCNWDNIFKIRNMKGYRVEAGETDSFGWVTGIIYFPNGKCIIYG